jgi:hypothetical protein
VSVFCNRLPDRNDCLLADPPDYVVESGRRNQERVKLDGYGTAQVQKKFVSEIILQKDWKKDYYWFLDIQLR